MQVLLQRPLVETSADDLTLLFAGGAKRLEDWKLGLELELFPVAHGSHEPAQYPALKATLENLGVARGLDEELDPDSGALIGLLGDGELVSIEPGGQLEYATKPFRTLRALRRAVTEFIGAMSHAANDQGLSLLALGYNPFETLRSIPRMPKARYNTMRAYLPERGRRSLEMMHLTASVQCAVDFSDEENMTHKVRTAARASPFIAALTASSPFTAGEPNGFRSTRYDIWLHTDDARCGLWPEMFDEEGLTFKRYVEHALRTPAMFFFRDQQYRVAEPRPYIEYAKEGFEGSTVTVRDFVDHLTTLFPEVRTKSYIELRGADCAPPLEAVAIAGFWRGLLDDADALAAASERLSTLTYEQVRELQPRIAREGLDARSPVGIAREVARDLVEIARNRFVRSAPDCAECLEPLVARAHAGRSLADELLERAASPSVIDALEICRVT